MSVCKSNASPFIIKLESYSLEFQGQTVQALIWSMRAILLVVPIFMFICVYLEEYNWPQMNLNEVSPAHSESAGIHFL